MTRYAIYFAPPAQHPLWQAGCEWLGRDPEFEAPVESPPDPLLADPWRYGFHATLKAPMALKPGTDEAAFLEAVCAVASRHRRFEMPPLRVGLLADFLALRPATPVDVDHPLQRLADACVVELDAWRDLPSAAELQRQTRPHFSARQREHVARYGYAHVLQDWRFHMSLTGSLSQVDPVQSDEWTRRAKLHFDAALRVPLVAEALCVFVQRAPRAPFRLEHRLPLRS